MGRVLRVLVLSLWLAASAAQAQPAPVYPPYPDVWGRELPAPAGRIVNGFFVRDSGAGDFVLSYAHHALDPATGNLQGEGGWARLDFFGGGARALTGAEADALPLRYPLPKARVRGRGGPPLVLPDGRKVVPTTREPLGVGCWVNYAGELMVLDKADKLIARKMVLRLLERPERREYWAQCESQPSGDSYLAKVDALSMVLYPLADGSFLAEGTGSPFMIRFRPDLASPFIEAHPNLFLVDAEEADRAVRAAYYAAGGQRIQAGNDALYDYAMELKKRKTRAN